MLVLTYVGDNVQISAYQLPADQVFDYWAFDSAVPSGADTNAAITSFAMPGQDVSVTASYTGVENTAGPFRALHKGVNLDVPV